MRSGLVAVVVFAATGCLTTDPQAAGRQKVSYGTGLATIGAVGLAGASAAALPVLLAPESSGLGGQRVAVAGGAVVSALALAAGASMIGAGTGELEEAVVVQEQAQLAERARVRAAVLAQADDEDEGGVCRDVLAAR